MRKLWIFIVIMLFIIVLDQITKGLIQEQMFYGQSIPVIKNFFSITYVKNKGAAFGMGAGLAKSWRSLLFLLLPVLACFWLIGLIWKARKEDSPFLLGLSYTLIFAGALGNLIDRFAYGHVVDFLDFYYNAYHFPAFNVADSAITIAAVLLILDFFIEWKKRKKEGHETDPNSSEAKNTTSN